jgi:hypothetical protein
MEKKNMKNPQREIIVICRNLRGYSLILPKMNINLHHTLKATNDKKCPTQQRCKKTKKTGTSWGLGEHELDFLQKESTWLTTNHSTMRIIQ